MRKKLTQESFIQRVEKLFGDDLDFSEAVYLGSKKHVKVICPIHGEFYSTPGNLFTGRGCYHCGILRRTSALRKTKDTFVEQATSVHGDRFDYSNTVLGTTHEKVEMRCVKHNIVFVQSPAHHLSGKIGCPACKVEHKTERDDRLRMPVTEFIERALQIHGQSYDYSLVEYKTNSTPVLIVCNEHGVFNQSPSSHLTGAGCPRCAEYGYNPSIAASLYVLKCTSDASVFTGYGITKDVARRLSAHKTNLRNAGFSVDGEYVSPLLSGDFAKEVEDALRTKYHQTSSHSKSIKGFKRENTSAPFEEVVAFVQKYLENREGN